MCSKDCRGKHLSHVRTGKHIRWGDDKREARRRAIAQDADGWAAMQRDAVRAAQLSPIAGPYETNRNAKIWRLVSPEGERYVARNLALFFRAHEEMIPGNTPGQAAVGIRQIAQSMRGKRPTVTTWRGWTLEGLPEEVAGEGGT